MSPSSKYEKIMKGKWKNTKEQKDLMLNEDCITIIMLAITLILKNSEKHISTAKRLLTKKCQ